MTTPGPRSWLQARYEEHNAARGRGFVYGGAERVAALRGLLPTTSERVLDLGCRDGALAQALGLGGPRTVGLDIDVSALAEACARPALQPCCADLWRDLPLRSRSFDLALAGEVIEHLPFPDRIVSELARVLRPDGCAVGSVPNAFRLRNRLGFLLGQDFEHDPTHLRHFSITSLRALLAEHFDVVDIRPAVGRFVRLWPRMTANDLVWRAARPRVAGHRNGPAGQTAARRSQRRAEALPL